MSKIYIALADDNKRQQLENLMYSHMALVEEFRHADSDRKAQIVAEIQSIRRQREAILNS